MQITEDQKERLFAMDQTMERLFGQPMKPEELRGIVNQSHGSPLAPRSKPYMLPIAGFQGNSVFPNAAGSGLLRQGQVPPPQSAIPLNEMGQPMQESISPQFPGQQQMMAQANGMPSQMGGAMGATQGRGFTTNIQIGEDGQVNSLTLKRAIQKARMQMGQA